MHWETTCGLPPHTTTTHSLVDLCVGLWGGENGGSSGSEMAVEKINSDRSNRDIALTTN